MSRPTRNSILPVTALAAILAAFAPTTVATAPDGALTLGAATAWADDRDDGRISYGNDDDPAPWFRRGGWPDRYDRDDDDDDDRRDRRADRDDDDDDDRRDRRADRDDDDDDDDRWDRDDDDDDDDDD